MPGEARDVEPSRGARLHHARNGAIGERSLMRKATEALATADTRAASVLREMTR